MEEIVQIKNRKLVGLGNTYGLVIPKAIVEDAGLMEKGKKYIIKVFPSDEAPVVSCFSDDYIQPMINMVGDSRVYA